MSRTVRRCLTDARLNLGVWATSGWISDVAWGVRVGCLVGVAAVAAVATVTPALGWWPA